MLSATEFEGLKNILDYLNDEELFSILETVTKRMFTTKRRDEAIDRILSCTENPLALLRRQKMTKKLIFSYLLKNGVQLSADLGKPVLMKKCLQLWSSAESVKPSKDEDFNEDEIEHSPSNETMVMGVAFSKWFFPILNTLSGFGPEHFWPKCSLQAQLYTPSDIKEVSIAGANDVAIFLSNLVIMDKFYFNANESEDSIMLEEDPHGLVKIVIKGVLHQYSSCIGLFDSAFGLVKDPFNQCTYKIQLIKLKMQANNPVPIIQPPQNHLSICQTVS